MGRIATANIYFANFDDNNICTLTNGIAHSLHKSYDTFSEALAAFQVYYPHCTTKQHMDFMNANTLLESSNLNNPCPYFRSLLRNYIPDPTKEVTWTMNLSNPTLAQLCKSSLTCMRQCNNNPSQAYDFLPPEFNRTKNLYTNYIHHRHPSKPCNYNKIYPQTNNPIPHLNTSNSCPPKPSKYAPPPTYPYHDAQFPSP